MELDADRFGNPLGVADVVEKSGYLVFVEVVGEVDLGDVGTPRVQDAGGAAVGFHDEAVLVEEEVTDRRGMILVGLLNELIGKTDMFVFEAQNLVAQTVDFNLQAKVLAEFVEAVG